LLPNLRSRRLAFGLLIAATTVVLAGWLFSILANVGFGILSMLLFVVFLIYTPSLAIPFWNSVVGFVLIHGTRDALDVVCHAAKRAGADDPIVGRVAVAMALHDEDATRAFAHFRTVMAALDRTGHGHAFDYHVLSDSSDTDVMAIEEREFQTWCAEGTNADRLFYRRRANAEGFKGGNVYDFCENEGKKYEILVLLDADSLMSGDRIINMVQIMQANPDLGLLQSLSVGLPSSSLFARVFQFGHRQAMRCFSMGATWWQGDSCHTWGHNCAMRVRPFVEYCRPLKLTGEPPFGGPMICHDQIEAALLHRASYAIRFLPMEGGSYEGNPPALPEFLARHVRWCQGNLQNLRLLNMPKLTALSRFHLAYVALKFIGAAAMVALVMLAVIAAAAWPDNASNTNSLHVLYFTCLLMYFAPRLLGITDAMIRFRRAYGGAARLLTGGFAEIILTFLLAPVAMVAATSCALTLPLGYALRWDPQKRDSYRVSWADAFAGLWHATALGVVLLLALMIAAPGSILWFVPFLASLILAVPFAVLTSSPGLGACAARWKLFATPEEIETPAEIANILPVLLRMH